MNRSEFEELRRRVAERSAAEGQDPPWLLAIAGGLFAALLVVVNFI